MPSMRKKVNKSGQTFYEIRVSRGRGKSYLTKRWYVPDGWSQRAIDRELASVAAEFERQCNAGEIISRAEQREKDAQEAAEAARILTLKNTENGCLCPQRLSQSARTGATAIRAV